MIIIVTKKQRQAEAKFCSPEQSSKGLQGIFSEMKNIYRYHMLNMPASMQASIVGKYGWDILKIRSILCWKIKIRKQVVDWYIMPDPETKARCFMYFNFLVAYEENKQISIQTLFFG